MNIIADMWRYAELCCHNKQDSGDNDKDHLDYIKDMFAQKAPGAIFTPMRNKLEYAYILEEWDRVIICFRGTDGWNAWWNNFDMFPLEQGYMHKGIHDLFCDFAPSIDHYIKASFDITGKDFSNCPKPIYCTGHSLGGILSQYCARHLAKNRSLPVSCINFGSPPGGTKQWRDEMDILPINNTRVVNGYDQVTRFTLGGIGYHAGKLFYMPVAKWRRWFLAMRIWCHAYSQYTDNIISYSNKIKDLQAVSYLKNIRKRVNI